MRNQPGKTGGLPNRAATQLGVWASVRIPDLHATMTRRVTSRSGRAYRKACAALLEALNCAKISSAYTSAPNSEGTE